jgi:hypothetical protein
VIAVRPHGRPSRQPLTTRRTGSPPWFDATTAGDANQAGPVRGLLQAAGIAPSSGKTDETMVGRTWRALPLVELIDMSSGSRYCATTTIDDKGRLADRTPIKALDWTPGTRVTVAMIAPAGIILARRGGPTAITTGGHLRLPADIRQGCRIVGGQRLLVVAHPDDDLLVAYTPMAFDAMATAYHTTITAQDVA